MNLGEFAARVLCTYIPLAWMEGYKFSTRLFSQMLPDDCSVLAESDKHRGCKGTPSARDVRLAIESPRNSLGTAKSARLDHHVSQKP